jgi:hypothetical protein
MLVVRATAGTEGIKDLILIADEVTELLMKCLEIIRARPGFVKNSP